jgi:hypothetical protein
MQKRLGAREADHFGTNRFRASQPQGRPRLVQSALRELAMAMAMTMTTKFNGTFNRTAGLAFLAVLAVHLILGASSGRAQDGSAGELRVAAAADLSAVLQQIGDSYEKKTGVKIKLSLGASGALTQQIQNGAPFDLFFSADMDYPRQLVASGEAEPGAMGSRRFPAGRRARRHEDPA